MQLLNAFNYLLQLSSGPKNVKKMLIIVIKRYDKMTLMFLYKTVIITYIYITFSFDMKLQ